MSERAVPPKVLEALEMLERATSPTELGEPYQVLLDWRRQQPMTIAFAQLIWPALFMSVLGAVFLFVSFIDVPVTDFWRGVQLGLAIGILISGLQNLMWRRTAPPDSLNRRIETAIDRWRHAVPAMRDIPK